MEKKGGIHFFLSLAIMRSRELTAAFLGAGPELVVVVFALFTPPPINPIATILLSTVL